MRTDRPWPDQIESVTDPVAYYTGINTSRCIVMPKVWIFNGHLLVIGGETANKDCSIAPSNGIE